MNCSSTPIPRISSVLTIITFAAVLSFASSCRRYTAPQEELLGAGSVRGGEDVFRAFEQAQRERLEALVTARSPIGAGADTNYRIGPDDVLQIQVFDATELSAVARVRADGMIALPIIGTLNVGGLNESEAEALIMKRLGEFMRSPQARISISEYAAHRVSIIGAVAKPGTYPLKHSRYSLLELLSEAGGRTEHAGGSLIMLPAQSTQAVDARASLGSGAPAPQGNGIEIDFDQLAGSVDRPPLALPLIAGDTVVVQEEGTVHVDGEVKKPGLVKLGSRMTLLGAIAAAEGLNYAADSGAVEVIRELGSGRKAMLTLDLERLALLEGKDVKLRDGDVVRVPSARGRFAVQQVMDFFGGMFNVGISSPVR